MNVVPIAFFLAMTCLLFTSVAADSEAGAVGNYIYWDDGISLTGPARHISLELGTKINYDLGRVSADNTLKKTFPGFDGNHESLRRLTASLFGQAFDVVEFKFEIDLSHIKDVKDNWIRFTKGDILPHFTFGHMKEPFSLDKLTGSSYMTFMEPALPTRAFSPGRNIGFTGNTSWNEERINFAGGVFLNTGSFVQPGEGRDQIEEANGFDLAWRLSTLPIYNNSDKQLLHMGLSYLYRFRDDEMGEANSELNTRPESRLTDDRLVATPRFYDQGQSLISLEMAYQSSSFLLQAEYFLDSVDSHRNLIFSGWYLQGSWVLTGENHAYRKNGGLFAGITPNQDMDFGGNGWGAFELAFRLSNVDLNDKSIQGGEENNFTVACNWYLKRKIRLMINFIHSRVEDRAVPYIETGNADIITSRFQMDF